MPLTLDLFFYTVETISEVQDYESEERKVSDQQETRLDQHVGEYRLVRKLGGGGFGTVYLAEHIHEHTQAAVKLLHLPLTKGEDFKDFLNEARTMRLRHPHIVPLLDFGMSRDELPFLVMEYALGGTLRDLHPKGERPALSSIVSHVDQIASALQYAHDQRVIHRDVKPANILIRADRTLMVSDFGIAKFLEQSLLTSQEKLAGTPEYMAPEQHKGNPCFASDQYALAVMVYEWICGVRPFQGPAIGLAVQHMRTPPPPLRDYLSTLPEAVEHVILKALGKAPEDRFERIQEFAKALQEAGQTPIVLSPSIEAINTAPLILPKPTVQPASDQKPEALVHPLTNTELVPPKPAMQTAYVPPSPQRLTSAFPSIHLGSLRNTASPPTQKVAPPRRKTGCIISAAVMIIIAASALIWLVTLPKPPSDWLATQQSGMPPIDGTTYVPYVSYIHWTNLVNQLNGSWDEYASADDYMSNPIGGTYDSGDQTVTLNVQISSSGFTVPYTGKITGNIMILHSSTNDAFPSHAFILTFHSATQQDLEKAKQSIPTPTPHHP